jgi:hypothetical protein
VAPSAIAITNDEIHTPDGKKAHAVPRALGDDEIPGIIDGFRGAKTLAAVEEVAPHAPGLTSTLAPTAMLDALMRLPDSPTQPPPRLQD